jgi:hypothetical protein
MAARELGQVSLADALALTLLAAEVEDERWPRAAARWLGRLISESPAITINEAALAAAAVLGLAGPDRPSCSSLASRRVLAPFARRDFKVRIRPLDTASAPAVHVLEFENLRGQVRWAATRPCVWPTGLAFRLRAARASNGRNTPAPASRKSRRIPGGPSAGEVTRRLHSGRCRLGSFPALCRPPLFAICERFRGHLRAECLQFRRVRREGSRSERS